MAASKVDSSRPCELPVSQSGLQSERNEAPALPILLIRSSSSRVDLAQPVQIGDRNDVPRLKDGHEFRQLGTISRSSLQGRNLARQGLVRVEAVRRAHHKRLPHNNCALGLLALKGALCNPTTNSYKQPWIKVLLRLRIQLLMREGSIRIAAR